VFRQFTNRALLTPIAQYYGIVQNGLVDARHAFRGLNRPLAVAANMKADQDVVVYSWRPKCDWEWSGTRFEGIPVPREPRIWRVFVVLVRPQELDEHGVSGLIERWNWVREDAILGEAPVDYEDRYGQTLWSRSDE